MSIFTSKVAETDEHVFVAFVVDGSQFARGRFDEVCAATKNLIDRVVVTASGGSRREGRATCMVITMSNGTTHVACPWTGMRERLYDALDAFKKGRGNLGGGMNMSRAFLEARSAFKRACVLSPVRPIVIVVATAAPDVTPDREFTLLTSAVVAPVQFFGACPQEKIASIQKAIPNSPVVAFERIAELGQRLAALAAGPQETDDPSERPIVVQFCGGGGRDGGSGDDYGSMEFVVQTSKEPMRLKYEVVLNPTRECQEIPAGTKITISGCDFFEGAEVTIAEAVTADSGGVFEGGVTLALTRRARAGLAMLPEQIAWRVSPPHMAAISGRVEPMVPWFCGDFLDTPQYNLLIFGKMGAGKSSLVNGLLNLFSGSHELSRWQMVLAIDGHVTKTFGAVDFGGMLRSLRRNPVAEQAADRCRFRIFDSWGVTHDSYPEGGVQLCHLLDGCIPDGFPMPSTSSTGFGAVGNAAALPGPPDRSRAIHAVAFVLPIGDAIRQEDLDDLTANLAEATSRAIRPLVVVTFLKTVEQGEAERGIQAVVDAAKLERADVIGVENYVEERFRTQEKDLAYRAVLTRLLENARKTWLSGELHPRLRVDGVDAAVGDSLSCVTLETPLSDVRERINDQRLVSSSDFLFENASSSLADITIRGTISRSLESTVALGSIVPFAMGDREPVISISTNLGEEDEDDDDEKEESDDGKVDDIPLDGPVHKVVEKESASLGTCAPWPSVKWKQLRAQFPVGEGVLPKMNWKRTSIRTVEELKKAQASLLSMGHLLAHLRARRESFDRESQEIVSAAMGAWEALFSGIGKKRAVLVERHSQQQQCGPAVAGVFSNIGQGESGFHWNGRTGIHRVLISPLPANFTEANVHTMFDQSQSQSHVQPLSGTGVSCATRVRPRSVVMAGGRALVTFSCTNHFQAAMKMFPMTISGTEVFMIRAIVP